MFTGVTVVLAGLGFGVTVVEAVVWELRFTGMAWDCVVVFAGITGRVVPVVLDSSTEFSLPQDKQIKMNNETAK
jgi:hypothetical protein